MDVPALHKSLLDYTSQPRTQEQMKSFLSAQADHDHGLDQRMLWYSASSLGWMVHIPPSGTWRYFGKNSYIAADQWLGNIEAPSFEEAATFTLRRYLAAFGPASRNDLVQWAGLRRVSPVDTAIHALGDEIIAFKDETGKTLYDLADEVRPGADAPAPVRFLPKWDNLLLAYQNRERVLPARYRKTVIKVNGDVMPSILVNGVVAGGWSITRSKDTALLNIELFEPIDPAARAQLEEEGMRLIKFVEPDASTLDVKISA